MDLGGLDLLNAIAKADLNEARAFYEVEIKAPAEAPDASPAMKKFARQAAAAVRPQV